MANASRSFRVTPQAVLGLIVITFGLSLLADNLGWMEAQRIIHYWPLGIVAVGVVKMVQSGTTSGRVFGGVITLVGLALTVDRFFILSINLWDWWPLIIVVFGLLILSKALGRFGGEPGVPPTASTLSDQTVSEFAIWAGIQRRIASSAFKHADLTAIMGGIEIDLRQASTAGGEAVIDVFAMWGGIEITVPPDWDVSNRVVPIMGGAEDSSTGTQAARHRLIVRGFAVMGGVEIKT